jgi:spermidine synthase
MNGPWLFEGEESFPELGGIKQKIQIGDFTEFGRGLVMDGLIQLSEACDAQYTTALAFPAALLAKSRRRWLVVGGGDGPIVREALRFRDTESVLLVDLSRMVIEKTRELIPSFWAGVEHDSRLTVECRDAWQVLRECAQRGERFDIVLFDLTDPACQEIEVSESAAEHLYTEEAFRLAAQVLQRGGVFAAQIQELSILTWKKHAQLRKLVQKHLCRVWSYRVFVECFGYWQSFVLASNDETVETPFPTQPSEALLRTFYCGDAQEVWSDAWHSQLFTLPPGIHHKLESP